MPSPITASKENALYTPVDFENDFACTSQPKPVCSAEASSPPQENALEPKSDASSRSSARLADDEMPDYFTFSVGGGEIFGADIFVTLDREGDVNLGVGAGISIGSPLSVHLQAGKVIDAEPSKAGESVLRNCLEGDSVQFGASYGPEIGIAKSNGGTMLEGGLGTPQAGIELQHSRHIGNVGVKW